jgi:hypothetical protein
VASSLSVPAQGEASVTTVCRPSLDAVHRASAADDAQRAAASGKALLAKGIPQHRSASPDG